MQPEAEKKHVELGTVIARIGYEATCLGNRLNLLRYIQTNFRTVTTEETIKILKDLIAELEQGKNCSVIGLR